MIGIINHEANKITVDERDELKSYAHLDDQLKKI